LIKLNKQKNNIACSPDREPEREEENVGTQNNKQDNNTPTRAPDNLCPVCLLNPRSAVFVPCGHALCYDCGIRIQGTLVPNNRMSLLPCWYSKCGSGIRNDIEGDGVGDEDQMELNYY